MADKRKSLADSFRSGLFAQNATEDNGSDSQKTAQKKLAMGRSSGMNRLVAAFEPNNTANNDDQDEHPLNQAETSTNENMPNMSRRSTEQPKKPGRINVANIFESLNRKRSEQEETGGANGNKNVQHEAPKTTKNATMGNKLALNFFE